jgi:hypothetical protein
MKIKMGKPEICPFRDDGQIYAKVTKNWVARRAGTQFTKPTGEAVTGSLVNVYE